MTGEAQPGPRRLLFRIRRHLHWWTAAFVSVGFAIAWVMTALPLTELFAKFLLYQLHKSLGLCVALLAVVRLGLAWRAHARQRGVQAALFALLLVVPVLGYFTAASSPTPIPTLFFLLVRIPHAIAPDQAVFDVIRPVHRWLAIGLMVLAAWHGVRSSRRASNLWASGLAWLGVARSGDAHPPAKPR
jgi:cytochrome b561